MAGPEGGESQDCTHHFSTLTMHFDATATKTASPRICPSAILSFRISGRTYYLTSIHDIYPANLAICRPRQYHQGNSHSVDGCVVLARFSDTPRRSGESERLDGFSTCSRYTFFEALHRGNLHVPSLQRTPCTNRLKGKSGLPCLASYPNRSRSRSSGFSQPSASASQHSTSSKLRVSKSSIMLPPVGSTSPWLL